MRRYSRLLRFHPEELEACRISQEEVEAIIVLIKKKLGPAVTIEIEGSDRLSTGAINRLCCCAAVVGRLSKLPGFKDVKEKIVSIYEPSGHWFQLIVGYLFSLLGEDVHFESLMSNEPSDITLRSDQIVIECKYFDWSERERHRVTEFATTGKVSPEPPDKPKAFETKILLWPWPGPSKQGSISPPIPTSHYSRFMSRLEDKYGQLVGGRCNILALNTDRITSDVTALKIFLQELLASGKYPRISAFFMIQRVPPSVSEESILKGEKYSLDLVCSKDAAIKVPDDLVISVLSLQPHVVIGLTVPQK